MRIPHLMVIPLLIPVGFPLCEAFDFIGTPIIRAVPDELNPTEFTLPESEEPQLLTPVTPVVTEEVVTVEPVVEEPKETIIPLPTVPPEFTDPVEPEDIVDESSEKEIPLVPDVVPPPIDNTSVPPVPQKDPALPDPEGYEEDETSSPLVCVMVSKPYPKGLYLNRVQFKPADEGQKRVVVVYTIPDCAPCARLKQELQNRALGYTAFVYACTPYASNYSVASGQRIISYPRWEVVEGNKVIAYGYGYHRWETIKEYLK